MSPECVYYTNHANAVGVGPEDGSWLIAPDGRIVDVQPPCDWPTTNYPTA